ncbi:hypothetical protein [Rhodohalobacter mucosus]|uniref:hypothetical protein n=1 Tax=Rhodohalobacter mucosus TaxID=2079485 RepID=UPI0011B20A1F|nr:hypothetical protein [Rhodohalobacter mucosus]
MKNYFQRRHPNVCPALKARNHQPRAKRGVGRANYFNPEPLFDQRPGFYRGVQSNNLKLSDRFMTKHKPHSHINKKTTDN